MIGFLMKIFLFFIPFTLVGAVGFMESEFLISPKFPLAVTISSLPLFLVYSVLDAMPNDFMTNYKDRFAIFSWFGMVLLPSLIVGWLLSSASGRMMRGAQKLIESTLIVFPLLLIGSAVIFGWAAYKEKPWKGLRISSLILGLLCLLYSSLAIIST